MGNKIENCKNICCYKDLKEQNMDKVNGVVYINPNQKQFNNLQSTNINKNYINSNFEILNIKQKNNDNQKITSQSTAMVSKKTSNKNLKNINLKMHIEDKYVDKETIISKEALNESINKIQKIFQNNLIEKKKNLIQNEEDLNKKMKIKRINSELLLTKYKNREIQNNQNLLYSENNENTKNESNDESGKNINNNSPMNFNSNNINNTNNNNNNNNINMNINNTKKNNESENSENENKDEEDIVSLEPLPIFSTYTNMNIKKNITITSNPAISSSSFYSKIDSIDISKQPKGYFLYKQKKYKYYGSRIEGKKVGFGIIKWNDGSIIKAIFKNSKIDGFSQFKDTQFENSIFQGEYRENIPKGYGYYIKDNVKIEGDNWDKNHLYGIGMEIWDDDNFYQGEFYKSLKNGIGLYRWPDGTLCFGEWKNNKLNGYGLMKYANDSIYVGEFKESLMDGLGEFLWNDTEYYCGYYKEGNKNGFGIYVWDFEKLSCYIGFWENGKQHGIGMKIIDNEQKFGFYKDGRKNAHLNGAWEIKEYLKPEQVKYQKFLVMNIKLLVKFILSLKNHDNIFKEGSING